MPFFSPFRRSAISSPAAFSQLYEANRLSVSRYVYGLTGGPQALVEDMVAETFLRAWKARHSFEGEPQTATGWLISIAKRLVIDDYRRETVRMSYPWADNLSNNSLPEQNAIEAEQRRTLRNLLATLPENGLELLTLRYMLGWKVGQIAAYLDKSEDAVSVSLHRLLARLREKWADGSTDESNVPNLMEEIK